MFRIPTTRKSFGITPSNLKLSTCSALPQRFANASASLLVVACAYLIYVTVPHVDDLRKMRSEVFGCTGITFLALATSVYAILLVAHYFSEASPGEAKALLALRGLLRILVAPRKVRQDGLPPPERLGLLTVIVKVFFAPLMALSLFSLINRVIVNGGYLLANLTALETNFLDIFNSHGFWFSFDVIVSLDVLVFTVGYLVEHPSLKNVIRSVDPTWLGWSVTMLCYPPISTITAYVLGGSVSEFPQFSNPTVHLILNFLVLTLMAIYTSASLGLGFKGSNLTHRGIVMQGPYRYVRHPAYAAKNLAWWVGTLPALSAAGEQSFAAALLVFGSSAAWTGIYVLRALTEEDHLKSVDGEYASYCTKVKYRFIPGLI
ncbi:MAG: DUF1295 domain-containing protein [Zoogloeaceae bacterium]|nr:DUF1295 domain-containing protein [Zoogloeaceae bacterium]